MQYRTQGNVVLERLKGQSVPASMKGAVKEFQGIHTAYAKASEAADQTRAMRDAALGAVADDDAVLDELVEKLAQKSVGAGVGTRKKPLAKYTQFSVSRLRALAYKKQADEVVALTGKIAKARLSNKDVVAASAACAKQAKVVLASLASLVKPQAEYAKAKKERDAFLPEWTRAYARLKKIAAAAWVDDEATYGAVFAPPAGVQAPKARRAKKKDEAPVVPPTA